MPTVPISTKCSHLGCKVNRSKFNTFCMAHGGVEEINTIKYRNAKGMYSSKRWLNIRKSHLSMQPLCQSCLTEGIIKSASDVDHVFAWQALDKSSFIKNIFQSLCHSCHSLKTGLEQKGVYRHFTPPTYIDYKINHYSSILESNAINTLSNLAFL